MEEELKRDLKKLKLLRKQLQEMSYQKIYFKKPKLYEKKREEYKKAILDFANKYDLNLSEVASFMKVSRQWIYYLLGKRIKTKKQKEVLKLLSDLKDALSSLKKIKSPLLVHERKEIRNKLHDLCAKAHFWYGLPWKDIEGASGLNNLNKRMHLPKYKKYVKKYEKEKALYLDRLGEAV